MDVDEPKVADVIVGNHDDADFVPVNKEKEEDDGQARSKSKKRAKTDSRPRRVGSEHTPKKGGDDEEIAANVASRERAEAVAAEKRLGKKKARIRPKIPKKDRVDLSGVGGTRKGSKNFIASLFYRKDGIDFVCKLCHQKKAVGSGLSNLTSHLAHKHEKLWKKALEENDRSTLMEPYVKTLIGSQGIAQQPTVSTHFKVTRDGKLTKKYKIMMSLLVWVLECQIPFNAVESLHFRRFGEEMDKELFSAYHLKTNLSLLYDVVVSLARANLKECAGFTITADMWTSIAGQKYLVITYHGVTRAFERVHHVLDLVPFYGASVGNLISSVICERVRSHVQSPKVMTVVTDSGSNMKRARQQVAEDLGCASSSTCFAHALKGVMDAVFGVGEKQSTKHLECEKAMLDIAAIKAVAEVCRLKADVKKFFNDEEDLVLISENVTRWEGRYTALDRFILLQDCFALHNNVLAAFMKQHVDPKSVPSDFLDKAFFKRVRRYKEALSEFHQVSVLSQGDETTSTLSAIPGWIWHLQKECETDTELGKCLRQAVDALLVPKFISKNSAALLAALVDPYAYVKLEMNLEPKMHEELWGQLVADSLSLEPNMHDDDARAFHTASLNNGRLILQKSMRQWAENKKPADPLKFWADTSGASRTLAMPSFFRVASFYLSGTATSAPSERAFSSTTGIVTKLRTMLSDAHLEQMTVCRDWIRQPAFSFDATVLELERASPQALEQTQNVKGEGEDDEVEFMR